MPFSVAPIQIVTVQRLNQVRRSPFEMVCICIKEAQHSPIMRANNNLNIFTTVASGSSEMCSNSNIENEPITWNWNPHATKSKSKSHSDCKANLTGHDKYSQQLSYNCYGQKLADAGNGDSNNRKRSHTSRNRDDRVDQAAEVKDANFWTKVLFGGNNDNNNDHRQPNDFVAVPSTSANERKSSANAVIFNSILSNLSNSHRSKAIQSISDIDTIDQNFNLTDENTKKFSQTASSDTTATNSKAKNSLLKRRPATSHENGHCDGNTFDDTASGSNRLSSRMSLHNDLNSINNTFLQALNDLHLDYNDSPTNTNGVADINEPSAATQLTSKERYIYVIYRFFSNVVSIFFGIQIQNSNFKRLLFPSMSLQSNRTTKFIVIPRIIKQNKTKTKSNKIQRKLTLGRF